LSIERRDTRSPKYSPSLVLDTAPEHASPHRY
jgi:hypothetical protein